MLLLLLSTAIAQEPAPVAALAPAIGWWAGSAVYEVQIPASGDPTLTLRYQFRGSEWGQGQLASPQLVVDSVAGPAVALPSGLWTVTGPGGPTSVVVSGAWQPSSPGELSLQVLPAARQQVIVKADPMWEVEVEGAMGGWLAPTDALQIHYRPKREAAPREDAALSQAEVGTAFWASEGRVEVRSRVEWVVRRGALSTLQVDLGGLQDVQLGGPNVARWSQQGSVAVVELKSPAKGAVSLQISGAVPLRGAAEIAVPRLQPLGAQRVSHVWNVARSEGLELGPAAGPGPARAAARDMPAWARGLAETESIGWWAGEQPPRVAPLVWTPLQGPDTVVERAEFIVSASQEGRLVLRSTWYVRNERAPYLHLHPPPGWVLQTVRRGNQSVPVLEDGQGGYLLPLERSIETLQGLTAFPVEVCWLATDDAWAKKGDYTFTLPAVDAPIQSAFWEVHLPRGVALHPKQAPGSGGVVLSEERRQQAALARQNAFDAYKTNNFSEAQGWLSQASALGADDEDVSRLSSNLALLLPTTGTTTGSTNTLSVEEQAVARRVRSLADAKNADLRSDTVKLEEEAKEAERSGEYDKAESLYRRVASSSMQLAQTEQEESTESRDRMARAEESMKKVQSAKRKQDANNDVAGMKDDANMDSERPEMVEGGVEGGVVGGVVGGVLGGVVGGVSGMPGYAAMGDGEAVPVEAPMPVQAPAPEPMPPEEIYFEGQDGPVEEVSVTMPVSRTYQTVVQSVPGVAARAGDGLRAMKREAPAPAAAKPAPPPPPPPPPPSALAGKSAPVTAATPPANQPAGPPEDLPVDTRAWRAPTVEASILSVALPLDGDPYLTRQDLMDAGAAPSLTLRYRTLSGDNR